jgi:hypothetical protein
MSEMQNTAKIAYNMPFSIEEIVAWAFKAGIKIEFEGVRAHGSFKYHAYLSTRTGNKVKSVSLVEDTVDKLVHRIRREYQLIFVKLQCPPMVLKPTKPYLQEEEPNENGV